MVLNTNLEKEEEILKLLPDCEKVGFSKTGYKLNSSEKLGNTWFHHAGLIYMQEPASMAPASLIEEKDGLKILDLCASPGGKTIDASLICGENSVIVSNEINRERAWVLFQNVERLALKNVIVTNNSPQELASVFNEYFDYVLVDAPCSGEGMFRKDPETISEWNEKLPEINSQRQKEIVYYADKMLKKGGYLIYSTCTYSIKENEEIVLFLLNNGYSIQKPKKEVFDASSRGLIKGAENACRFYPFNGVGEGQFVCLLQKIEQKTIKNDKTAEKGVAYNEIHIKKHIKNAKTNINNEKTAEKTANLFIQDVLNGENFEFFIENDKVYAPINNELKNMPLRFIAKGINVGTVVKNRIEPHHQFFKVFGNSFKIKIDLTKEDAEKYLAGEEIEIDSKFKGFASVLYNGVILGGGKASQGRLKNYYPKALRTKLKI